MPAVCLVKAVHVASCGTAKELAGRVTSLPLLTAIATKSTG